MATYTTTEVRSKIASDIRLWRRCRHDARAMHESRITDAYYNHHIYALRFLAVQFAKDRVQAAKAIEAA